MKITLRPERFFRVCAVLTVFLPAVGVDDALGESPGSLSLPSEWVSLPRVDSTTSQNLELSFDRLLVRRWTVDDGLPTNTLLDIGRDANGFIWLASYNGLIRFDGLHFEVLKAGAHPDLETGAFVSLSEGPSGLWLGTQGNGFWRLRHGRHLEPLDVGASGFKAQRLFEDVDGALWLGFDSGLFRSVGSTAEPVVLGGAERSNIHDMIRDPDGVLWIASEGDGLGRLDGEDFRWLTAEDGQTGRAVTSLALDGERLWVGTLDGLSVLEDERLRPLAELRDFGINHLNIDGQGHLWMAGIHGLARRHGRTGEVEILRELDDVGLQALSQVQFDPEGSVWITSMVNGLLQLRPSSFETWTRSDGLRADRVTAVTETPSGDWLLGMDEGVVHRLQDGEVLDVAIEEPPSGRIWDLHEDRAGNVWIATYSGLLRLSEKGETWWTVENGLPTNQIRQIFEDRRGGLWLTTQNAGLVRLKDPRRPDFDVVDSDSGLPSSFVFSVEEAADGRLFVGTLRGLAVIRPPTADDPRISVLKTVEDARLPGPVIFNVLLDNVLLDDGRDSTAPAGDRRVGGPPESGPPESGPSDSGWLATDRGLGRFEGERFYRIQEADGLPVEAIYDVQRDGAGSLWLSSSVGVVEVNERALIAGLKTGQDLPHFNVSTEKDGMSHRQCTSAIGFHVTRDGRLLFPTFDGLSVLDPGLRPKNPVPPPLVIDRVVVDGLETAPRQVLVIAPGVRHLDISFAALSFVDPADVELRYRLEGFDDTWRPSGPQRQASYTNLDPGRYTFRVIGANADGVLNEQGAEVQFQVRAHLHQEPWAVGLGLLLLLVGTREVVVRRMRSIRERNAYLQEVIERQEVTAAENARLLSRLEAKHGELERFAYTVSHDLKSPLVTIRGFAGSLREDLAEGDLEQASGDLELILGASDRMEDLLNELAQLIRVGHLTNLSEHVPLTEVALDAAALTAGPAKARNAVLEIDPNLPVVRGDRSRLVEVFQNLIENALKFSRPDLRPMISIGSRSSTEDGKARDVRGEVVFVRDNGIGIPKAHQEQVFGLFKRLSTEVEGTGAGLAIVKRTIEAHGGHIWVESAGRNKGATFLFTFGHITPGEPRSEIPLDPGDG